MNGTVQNIKLHVIVNSESPSTAWQAIPQAGEHKLQKIDLICWQERSKSATVNQPEHSCYIRVIYISYIYFLSRKLEISYFHVVYE